MLEKLGDPLEQVLDLLNISDIVSEALVSEEWFNTIYVFRKKLRKRILTEASILRIQIQPLGHKFQPLQWQVKLGLP